MLRKLFHVRLGRRFLFEESGQVVVVAAIGFVVICAFIGFSLDVGHLLLTRQRMHGVADGAALAAGLELRTCGSLASCPAMQSAVQSSLAENGYSGSTLLTNCATSNDDLTVTLNSPPCAVGASDPNSGKKGFIEVVVTQNVQTYFMRMMGFNNIRVSARAEASRNPGDACMYALDPTASAAFSITVALGLNSQCGIVVESSSPAAASCLLGLGINVPYINIHGGAAGLLCAATGVNTGVPVPIPADPLAYLPKPAVGACGSKIGSQYYGSSSNVNIALAGTYTFNPGVYCGGISMTAAILANVTFNPGVYILTTGPGPLGFPTGGLNLTLSLLSNIQGSGVTFYNYGPVGGISVTAPATLGLSNFSLTAPGSGVYSGILFMQDPGNTTAGIFLANLAGAAKLEGAIYLPTASATYGVSAVSSAYTILVAKSIGFTVAVLSQFNNDYSGLDFGSPLNGDRTALVQ